MKNNINSKIQKELDLIKESVLKVIPDTEAIYLFGSHAYGTPHKDSDLDVYVVIPDIVDINTLDVSVDIRMDLCKRKTMPMDLLVGKSSVFNRRKKHLTLENTVAEEGVLIYGT